MGGKSKKPGTLPSAGELFTELNTFKEVVVPNPFLRALGQTSKYKKYGLKQAKLKEKPDTKRAGGLKEATARLKAQGLKKGGKKKKFPDLSGDGKVTMKDILMGRGIIKKTKKKTKNSKS